MWSPNSNIWHEFNPSPEFLLLPALGWRKLILVPFLLNDDAEVGHMADVFDRSFHFVGRLEKCRRVARRLSVGAPTAQFILTGRLDWQINTNEDDIVNTGCLLLILNIICHILCQSFERKLTVTTVQKLTYQNEEFWRHLNKKYAEC